MPRRPLGDAPMSTAQRVTRHRQNQAAELARLKQAISTAIEHIDRHMGDTDPSDPEHPLLLAMQALTGALPHPR